MRFIRIWTVTAVTPVARMIEGLRGGGTGFLHNYILLHDTNEENRRLQAELDRLKMENIFLKNELNTADRAKALQVFQAQRRRRRWPPPSSPPAPGRTPKWCSWIAAPLSGVERGMAVVTPDGIVGKVIAAYPTASEVLLITDPDFAAGVIFAKDPGARHAQRPGHAAVQGGLRAVRREGGARRVVLHLRRRPHFPARLPRGRRQGGAARSAVQRDPGRAERHCSAGWRTC